MFDIGLIWRGEWGGWFLFFVFGNGYGLGSKGFY